MRQMKDSEDMLAKGGWEDCACFVKYYDISCIQVVLKRWYSWSAGCSS